MLVNRASLFLNRLQEGAAICVWVISTMGPPNPLLACCMGNIATLHGVIPSRFSNFEVPKSLSEEAMVEEHSLADRESSNSGGWRYG